MISDHTFLGKFPVACICWHHRFRTTGSRSVGLSIGLDKNYNSLLSSCTNTLGLSYCTVTNLRQLYITQHQVPTSYTSSHTYPLLLFAILWLCLNLLRTFKECLLPNKLTVTSHPTRLQWHYVLWFTRYNSFFFPYCNRFWNDGIC